jgi:hypothetical protein
LFLSALAIFFPIAAVIAENEIIHKAFVIGAFLTSGLAIYQIGGVSKSPRLSAVLLIGTVLLAAAAFLEPFESLETPLTVAGALILSSSHLWRRFAAAKK